jgi:hypothetical protein
MEMMGRIRMLVSNSIAKFDSRAPRIQRKALPLPMVILAGFLALLFLVPGRASGQAKIPDTPAGKTLQVWLEALNSGDRAKMEDYIHRFDPHKKVEEMMRFHDQTGGFDLIAIDSSEPLLIVFRVKEKQSSTVGIGTLELKDARTGAVGSFSVLAVPPGSTIDNVQLDAAYRQRIIDSTSKNLKELYVYPDLAQKMADALSEHQRHGDYEAMTNPAIFAFHLTKDLQDVSHDKHLHVSFSPTKLPEMTGSPTPDDMNQMRKMLQHENCGFEKVEILPHNIGYLKFAMFADPGICGPTAAAAMKFLAHVDAVIFDLRENGGGDPKMVQMICSYFFDKPAHLNDLYDRKEDLTTQYWTLPYLPGDRMPEIPVFVLTSSFTFSGAEEFSYNLKNLKRATIVGETTGGGAHPTSGLRLDDHFLIAVPGSRAINPVTKTDWEGVGVEPDVKVKAADALDEAEKLAISKLPADQKELR